MSHAEFRRLTGQRAPKPKRKIPQPPSELNRLFWLAYRIEREKLGFASDLAPRELVAEHTFHPIRKWRFDYAVPEAKIAVELVGVYSEDRSESRHRRIGGMENDYEKHNAACSAGWYVLYATRRMIPAVARQLARQVLGTKGER